MHWKQTLAGYAQDTFGGVFGSEGGVEWAVPYGDYFEGILSKKTQAEPGKPYRAADGAGLWRLRGAVSAHERKDRHKRL